MSALPAVILAGGLSTRMGGGNKALRMLAGETLLSRVIARLSPQCGRLAINANGEPEQFAEYGLPVIADGSGGFAGPLAGVLAGMEWAAAEGADSVVSVSVDTPFLPEDLVHRLREAAGRSGVAIAASPDDSGQLRDHPTCALWPVSLGAAQAGLDPLRLWPGVVTAFVAFRLFDIWKPGPAGWADRLHTPLGLMLDDIFAGVFAAVVVVVAAAVSHGVLM